MDGTQTGSPSATPSSTVRVEERLRCLQRVSLELAAATTIEQVVATAIEDLDAPIPAPTRALWLRTAADDHLTLTAHHGMAAAAAAQFDLIPLSSDLPGAIAAREGRTIVSAATADALERFTSLRDVPRSTPGFVALPLLGDQGCVGVLGVGFDLDEQLDDGDLHYFEAVAAQITQTVVRVRLAQRDRRRRDELEFLTSLTDAALTAVDHVDLMHRACTRAVPTLGDWCSLFFVPRTGGNPIVASAHVDPAKARYIADLRARVGFDVDSPAVVATVIRTGRTEFVPLLTPQVVEAALASSKYERQDVISVLDHLGITSAIVVPLRTKRGIVGAMQFVSAESRRRYETDDVALAEAVAGRLAEALDAAWMADQQRAIAVTLQQALLPPVLPAVPGIDIAARYWPAGISQVGGDFYDVFAVAEDHWALLIGDTCGTGPDAAAMTSLARHTVRAAARHGVPAAELMAWLNEAVLLSNRDLFCTACFATLGRRGDAWSIRATCAGHPLPIVATADGTQTLGQPGTLLGVFEQVTTTTAELELRAGDVVVLYTDGITDLPPPYGIATEELVDQVHELRSKRTADEIAGELHRALLRRVPDRSRQDDVAVLVVRID